MSVQGTVKFYNAGKGYGFIRPDDGTKDIFVHATDLNKSKIENLPDGQRVRFVPAEGKNGKGPRATELVLI